MAHLLVIDDEGDIRHLYAAELEDDGHTVVTCGNRSDALEQIHHQLFDLIILDIQLDQESGLERTAYSSYKDDFSSWLADAYVVKSSNLNELKDEVRRILAKS
jgi:DNA-binding response OmpR family regulator